MSHMHGNFRLWVWLCPRYTVLIHIGFCNLTDVPMAQKQIIGYVHVSISCWEKAEEKAESVAGYKIE